MQGRFCFDWSGMNTDSSETKRLADAVASVAATIAEIFNEKLKTVVGSGGAVMPEPNPIAKPVEYPNRYTPIPPNGQRCEFTGMKHAKLYDILSVGGIARDKVRVANLRTPGTNRGQTLFHVGDMMRFLDELAASNQVPGRQ